jgi:hypothetical protein
MLTPILVNSNQKSWPADTDAGQKLLGLGWTPLFRDAAFFFVPPIITAAEKMS